MDTPLHKAAIEGHLDIYQMIIPNLHDKNPRNYGGFTPLHIAAEHGHSEICWVVEENPKSDLVSMVAINNFFKVENLKNASGDTPLHKATINGHLEVFSLVTSRIQNINPRNYEGFTPLHFAAGYGNLSICQYMIKMEILFGGARIPK